MPRNTESKASNNPFKSGDIVQLKSGGPKMTVKNPDAMSGVECHWFAGAKLEHGYFQVNTLVKVEEDEEKKS